MPTIETIEQFIKAVETKPHDEVIAEFYSDDASIQENQNEPRVGKVNLIRNKHEMLKKAEAVHSKFRPFFQKNHNVVLKWNFRFEWKDGTTTNIGELVHQEWENDKIKREQFFYVPKQFVPKRK